MTTTMAVSSHLFSQSEIIDERFAELLKPIKDLTKNWEVPLAEMLSSYIEDLQKVDITIDGFQTTLNFSQAALMLQGTTSVYSKKVDFLWKLVNQALDMLSSRNSDEEGGDGNTKPGSGARKKSTLDMTEEFQLLEFDFGKNIDLKYEDKPVEELKSSLNFIYVTPSQLVLKESSEYNNTSIDLYTGVGNAKWDLLARKEDFRSNSQYVSITGCLGEALNANDHYISLNDDDTKQYETNNNSTEMSSVCNNSADDIDICPDLFDASVEPVENNASCQEPDCQRSFHSSSSPVLLHNGVNVPDFPQDPTDEPEFDPWAQLDPYQQVDTPRPIKKGNITKLPPSLVDKEGAVESQNLIPISEYLFNEMSSNIYKPAIARFPDMAPVFYDLANEEVLRRREREAEIRRENIASGTVRRKVFTTEEHCDEFFEEEGMPDEDSDDGVNDVDDHRTNISLDLPDPHMGGEIGPVVHSDIQINHNGETDIYEELVARKVNEYLSQTRNFLMNTDLARKVAAWHEMIGPKLELIENNKHFDIHAYGTEILNSFPNGMAIGGTVAFTTVVKGCSGEEIARYFLSALMLANTKNIRIHRVPESDAEMVMDNVMLTLLSTARHHHQLEEFRAVSQEDGDSVLEVELIGSIASSIGGSSSLGLGIGENAEFNQLTDAAVSEDLVSDGNSFGEENFQFKVPEVPKLKPREVNK